MIKIEVKSHAPYPSLFCYRGGGPSHGRGCGGTLVILSLSLNQEGSNIMVIESSNINTIPKTSTLSCRFLDRSSNFLKVFSISWCELRHLIHKSRVPDRNFGCKNKKCSMFRIRTMLRGIPLFSFHTAISVISVVTEICAFRTAILYLESHPNIACLLAVALGLLILALRDL